jgi:glycosyltransferase involved in cell wall biosynthesis
MKVTHVCAIGFTASNLLLPQVRYLRSLGHEVTFVFSPDPVADEIRTMGFGVEEIYISRHICPEDAVSTYKLTRHFERERPDVVHTHTSKGGFVGRIAARMARVRHVVHTIHGFPFIPGQNPLKYRAYHAVEKALAKLTDLLLSQSAEDVALAEQAGIRAKMGSPVFIGNGIDLGRFDRRLFSDADRRMTRERLQIGDEPVIAMVARLTLGKGYAEIIRALSQNRHRPWTALFVGPDDGGFQFIENSLKEEELVPRVRILRQRPDVDRLLAITDVFVLPSYREGVPRSVIEAQAMGIPVIATDIRGCREIVVDGQTGLLVPPKDDASLAGAIADLLEDEEKRVRMGAEGAIRARTLYDEHLVFGRIERAYRTLLGSD